MANEDGQADLQFERFAEMELCGAFRRSRKRLRKQLLFQCAKPASSLDAGLVLASRI